MKILVILLISLGAAASALNEETKKLDKCLGNIKNICGTHKITNPPDKLTEEDLKAAKCRILEITKCLRKSGFIPNENISN